jgi:hypothetical protein
VNIYFEADCGTLTMLENFRVARTARPLVQEELWAGNLKLKIPWGEGWVDLRQSA